MSLSSSASPPSERSTESTPVPQSGWNSGDSARSDASSGGGDIASDQESARDASRDSSPAPRVEIPNSEDSDEELLHKETSFLSDGSVSPLSSLGSRTPTPPSSPTITVRVPRDQHAIIYRPRLDHCECEHWCHCERYKYFRGGLDQSARHVDEDRQPIDSVQPWRVPNQQHLSNLLLDAEILPESSMRSTYTPAYGHNIKSVKVEQDEKVILLGVRPEAPKEPTFHRSDGTQRFSWEAEGYGVRAPHRWQGDSWRGALSQDGWSEVSRAPEGQWLAMNDGQPIKVVGGKRELADEWDGKAVEVEFDGRAMKRMKSTPGSGGEGETPAALADEGVAGAYGESPAKAGDNGQLMADTDFITDQHPTVQESGEASTERAQAVGIKNVMVSVRSDVLLQNSTLMTGHDEVGADDRVTVAKSQDEQIKLEDEF